MRKITQRLIKSIFVLFLFLFSQCTKEKTPLNITLYNKPLKTIQSHIQGKWKLHYAKGGYASTLQRYDSSNVFYNFTSDNKIQISNNGRLIADTKNQVG